MQWFQGAPCGSCGPTDMPVGRTPLRSGPEMSMRRQKIPQAGGLSASRAARSLPVCLSMPPPPWCRDTSPRRGRKTATLLPVLSVYHGSPLPATVIPNGSLPFTTLERVVTWPLVLMRAMFPANARLTHREPSGAGAMTALLSRNTLVGSPSLQLQLRTKIDPPLATNGSRPLQVETSANIFHGGILFTQSPAFLAKEKALSAGDAELLLTKLVDWRENRNLFFTPGDGNLLSLVAAPSSGKGIVLSPTAPIKTLADWKRFWEDAEALQERARPR